ncbi:hypothetical protein AMS60_05415 [Bacillus sp. FJAT-21945]|nr:hypothetical protein AMS60_05415 [Bacillus sp. FJAT-21945]
MQKEKLMQFLSEAIDNGAEISIFLGQFNRNKDFTPVTRKDAFRLAGLVQEAIGGEIKEIVHKEVCDRFDIETDNFKIAIAHSPHRYMIEDVDLSGSAEIA